MYANSPSTLRGSWNKPEPGNETYTPATIKIPRILPLPAQHTIRNEAPVSVHLLRNCTYHHRQFIPVRKIRLNMHRWRTWSSPLRFNPSSYFLLTASAIITFSQGNTGKCVSNCGYRQVSFDSNCDRGESILLCTTSQQTFLRKGGRGMGNVSPSSSESLTESWDDRGMLWVCKVQRKKHRFQLHDREWLHR